MQLNELQEKALLRKWEQDNQGMTYQQFRNTVQSCLSDDCVMVQWSGMWLGIETDGYTHS
jgi:hypothetical protein